MEYDPASIEQEWRDRWDEEGWYEVDPDEDADDVTFVTVAYPYPNGAMHTGHVRTFAVPDVYARYRRLHGDQVLYPMAWHITGTPIIGAVERLKERESEQVRILTEVYEVDEADFSELETPMGFARYFIENSYKYSMQLLGLSIDWRREFTTNDPSYREFISWQYETLHERGLLKQDTHPVNFCTNEEQPVTTHDILEGEEEEFQSYTLVKFRFGETVIPMATLRPETVRGVTNAFINPDAEYVRASVDGETWIVSARAAEKLDLQERTVEVLEPIGAAELIGESVINPITKDELPILPASFVDPSNGTGIVMSVPAHSPDDWVTLESLRTDPSQLEVHGIDSAIVEELEPIPILDIEGYGEIPAAEIVDRYGITDPDDPALEEATQELYNHEFHGGVLLEMYGEFAGEIVEEIRDTYQSQYTAAGHFDSMYDFSTPVICRCGGRVEVAEQDTWFLRYNDPDWRSKTERALEGVDVQPTNARDQYEHTIGWLEEWPCIRNYGLGTPLPWDDDFIIEPLSDSTIYMAYYTLAPHLDDDVDRALFNEIFLADDPSDRAAAMRAEFEHWYPVDVRFSANDLITNHLTFYLYHHAELFDEPLWPQGITTMGMGFLRGKSMSSSAGRVVLAHKPVERYGADTVRFFLMTSAEPWQDFDWRDDPVADTYNQLARFWRRNLELIDGPSGERELTPIDEWLLGRLNRVVESATDSMEEFEIRAATQAAFFELEDDLRWYRRRTETDRPGARWTLREVLRKRLLLLNPIIPFMTNELHERLTGEPAEVAGWPGVDDEFMDPALDAAESLRGDLVDDIQSILDVTESDPSLIRIYTAAEWKRGVLEAVIEADEPTHGEVMGRLMSEERYRHRGDQVSDMVGAIIDLVHDRSRKTFEHLMDLDEMEIIEGSASFLEREFGADIEVYSEDSATEDPADRAKHALPGRPAIHLE